MELKEEITPVREAHRLNTVALADFLGQHLPGFSGSLTVGQFVYGQSNPTFLLSAGGREYVLRKKPPGKLLPSAHAVDREFRIIKAMKAASVPVPEPYLLCLEDSVIGTSFYVMERVSGRIFRDPTASRARNPQERARIFEALNETLAKIHKLDWQTAGLADFGKPGNYMARQVSRWTKQYEASQTEVLENMDLLIRWLREHIPAEDDTAVVHGDYRLENTIFHPSDTRILAVLDWELSTLGHPLADLAYSCLSYHLPAGELSGYGYLGLDLQALGIPEEAEYVRAYCRRTGRETLSDWTFFIAFSLFRLAAIVQGVYKRGLDGNASSDNTRRYRDYARFLSDSGWFLVVKES
ncbi:MAG: phosphotransferase [Deltaproteobacteria bacterium]|nr:phosphotransferase [Deltaproteobacteria bacterium]